MREQGIRLATIDDFKGVEKINDDCGLSRWSLEDYRRRLQMGDQMWVLENTSGRLEGFVLARFLPPEMEILKLAVVPARRRNGIGSGLLATALETGRRWGCRECYLEVRRAAKGAIRFYSRNGFRPAGVRRNYYRNPEEDAVVMKYQESRNE